ncbi:MAG: hypothetical protein PHV23_00425 [Candidatus Gracilibacteria bacterium]|nr:hypothetical protein [Candidatus Gracilibacteria bacterium]
MKKIIISIFSSLVLLLSIQNTYAYDLSRNDIVTINKIVSKIEKNANILGIYYRDIVIAEYEVSLRKLANDSNSYFIMKQLIIKLKQIKFFDLAKKEAINNKVNLEKLKENWLNWHNDARYNSKLKTYYSYDERLDNTAFQWSINNKEKGIMDHKRFENSSFYDSSQIENWLLDRGVKCKAINGITSSESLGYHSYYCKKNQADCSDEAIKAAKEIFEMFMSEKGLKYPLDAHYRAIVHKNLNYIGFGLAIKKEENNLDYKDYDYYKIYITTHYCSEFIK